MPEPSDSDRRKAAAISPDVASTLQVVRDFPPDSGPLQLENSLSLNRLASLGANMAPFS